MADLIDRQALLEQLDCSDFTAWEDYSRVFDMIDFAPTVEPKREEKRGEWFGGEEMYSCSYCWKQVYIASDFCPAVGAEMRAEV